ncbi:expressed unknown protein [Seminavis robusta]|uniref:Uncharacterized protein n=1 Tax=Seminavis robusta TaxID=568900 RepID=A0A9N8DA95_9STRA|nr:expressed unknown protein [Seminavis robusta]|eukprot:Sro32_g020932.1  (149) ;mRNA; f:112187-112633
MPQTRHSTTNDDDVSSYRNSLYARRHSIMAPGQSKKTGGQGKKKKTKASRKRHSLSTDTTSTQHSANPPSNERRSSLPNSDTQTARRKLKNPFKRLRRRRSMNDASQSHHYYGDGDHPSCSESIGVLMCVLSLCTVPFALLAEATLKK